MRTRWDGDGLGGDARGDKGALCRRGTAASGTLKNY